LNNIRQSIAAIIVLEAYPYLVDKKLVKYIIVTLIATIFHISALIAIPVYFIVNNDIVRKYLFSFCLTLCILLPILAKFALYLISHTKYEYFLVSEFNNGDANTVNIIYGFVYFVISFILLYKDRMRYKEVYVLLIMQFFYFFVSIISIFIPVSEMISRIASYFLYYQILLIPYIVYREYKISGKIIFLTFYTLTYGIYMVYFIVLKGYHSVLPFKFCF
jgi:transmembrane protein EpsG